DVAGVAVQGDRVAVEPDEDEPVERHRDASRDSGRNRSHLPHHRPRRGYLTRTQLRSCTLLTWPSYSPRRVIAWPLPSASIRTSSPSSVGSRKHSILSLPFSSPAWRMTKGLSPRPRPTRSTTPDSSRYLRRYFRSAAAGSSWNSFSSWAAATTTVRAL